jgi:hydroxypyruvate isomerase
MPKFAANLTMLFTEHPFLDRFEHAAKAGFKAVEFLFPYAFLPRRSSPAGRHGLALVLHNLPAGDWDAGERGIACHPTGWTSSATASAGPSPMRRQLGVGAAQLPGRQGARRRARAHVLRHLGGQPALCRWPS